MLHIRARMGTRSAFTVVELLIVIVVIGILATLTIIAYSGVQDDARRASLQSDLSQSAKKLEEYKFKNAETFPSNLAAAQTAGAVKTSGANTPTYTTYTTPAGANTGYCMQNSVSGINYYVTSGGAVKEGVCQTITNLIVNPNFELNGSSWSGSNVTPSRTTSTYHRGVASLSFQHTGAVSDGYIQSASFPVTAGQIYRGSMYVRRTGATTTVNPWLVFRDASNAVIATVSGGTSSLPASTGWVQKSVNATAPANATSAGLWLGIVQPGTSDTFYIDSAMVTLSATLFEYADGSSPNWNWTGTANASSSSGPAL